MLDSCLCAWINTRNLWLAVLEVLLIAAPSYSEGWEMEAGSRLGPAALQGESKAG